MNVSVNDNYRFRKIDIWDKKDSDSFGGLFELLGGILISFAILEYIKSIQNISIFTSSFLIGGLGYLVFMFGFFIKIRNRQQIIESTKNLLWITSLLLILSILIWIN